ncbi:MAG: MFS transporter [Brachymonas sp.]
MTQQQRTTGMTRSRWWLLGSLYTTQTLGAGFFLVAFTAILRESGASLDRIGMVYGLGVVGALKFLWAPAVDRWRLGQRQAHYRGWLLTMQAGMFATMLVVAQLDLGTQFPLIFALCLVSAFFSATQDVATDALACRLLAPHERAMGNAIQGAGGMLGWMIGGGLVLMAYPHMGWTHSLWILAAGVAVSWLQLLWFNEPVWPVPQQLPRFAHVRRFWSFWRESGSGWRWPLLLMLYGTGISLAYALMTPLIVDAGWALDRIGFVANVYGMVLGMVASVLAGRYARRVNRQRALVVAGLVQIVAVLGVGIVAWGLHTDAAIWWMVSLYFLAYPPATTVLATLIMDHASKEFPATDYSMQYGLCFLFSLVASSSGLMLAQRLGYTGAVVVALVLCLLALALALIYRPRHGAPAAPAAGRTNSQVTGFKEVL